MKAPEKIYIFENPISGTPDDRWLSKRSDEKDIEYTRTDAFIEKACNAYCNTCGNSRCSGIGCAKLSTFKEQLNNRL